MGVPYAEVIGDPVAHSKSPQIHKFWLERLGLAGDYRATRVGEAELADYLSARRTDPDWRGCNITMPLKRKARDHVESVDPPAGRIGSINTLIPHPAGLLLGVNTDWLGVHFALDAPSFRPASAAIVGTGGAARAALEALRRAHVSHIVLISRTPGRAEALLKAAGVDGEGRAPGPAPEADLLINASPLGMTGFPPLDMDLSALAPNATVFDMVYTPPETALLRRARQCGLRTVDGLEMLIGQAAMAFTYFYGEPPPEEVYAEELRALLLR